MNKAILHVTQDKTVTYLTLLASCKACDLDFIVAAVKTMPYNV